MGSVDPCNARINRQLTASFRPCFNEGCAHGVALIFIEIDKERAALTSVAPDFCMGFVPLKLRRAESLAQSICIKADQAVRARSRC